MTKEWNVATLEDVATFFGVAYQTVRRSWTRLGMPGSSGCYPLDAITRWRILKLREAENPTDKDDSLERLRQTNWKLKELELRRKQNELVDRDVIHAELMRLANMLRAAGQRLQLSYGAEAQLILDETLDDFIETVDRELGNTTPGE